MRKVTIRPALNGWKCHVGCVEVVFQDKDELLKELSSYIDDPVKVEEVYLQNAVNKELNIPQPTLDEPGQPQTATKIAHERDWPVREETKKPDIE